ncbi:MAG: hypothetical protein U5L00_07365 [Desulfovermiculus sp.]|nr:hypothetical protein [Desulfovermiculus sp.]
MKSIRQQVNEWIDEEELPSRPGLKVLRSSASHFDPCEGMDEDDREAYWEFISWFISREHLALLSLPVPVAVGFTPIEPNDAISFPFGSMDFERKSSFKAYSWRLKMIFDRVKDLAETHSCISQEQGKRNIFRRYQELVEREFRDKALQLLETYTKYPQWTDKDKVFKRIQEYNAHIGKCKAIWRDFAYRP